MKATTTFPWLPCIGLYHTGISVSVIIGKRGYIIERIQVADWLPCICLYHTAHTTRTTIGEDKVRTGYIVITRTIYHPRQSDTTSSSRKLISKPTGTINTIKIHNAVMCNRVKPPIGKVIVRQVIASKINKAITKSSHEIVTASVTENGIPPPLAMARYPSARLSYPHPMVIEDVLFNVQSLVVVTTMQRDRARSVTNERDHQCAVEDAADARRTPPHGIGFTFPIKY